MFAHLTNEELVRAVRALENLDPLLKEIALRLEILLDKSVRS